MDLPSLIAALSRPSTYPFAYKVKKPVREVFDTARPQVDTTVSRAVFAGHTVRTHRVILRQRRQQPAQA